MMTATIVMHGSRTPFPADLAARVADEQAESLGLPSIGVAGDANVTADIPLPPGQLWERVAEREPGMTVRLAIALAQSDARTLDGDTIIGRGPRLGGGYSTPRARQSCNTYRMAASGIIRAGERIA